MKPAAAILLGLMLAAAVAAPAQVSDPLTPSEAAQVRDTAGKPEKRLPLLLAFAEQRLTQFEQVRLATPRPPGRDAQLYALLRQYAAILPEYDNAAGDLASGAGRTSLNDQKKYNLLKILTPGVATLQHLQTMLQHIQTASSPSDLANYHFELQECLDVTSDTLQDTQDDLPPAPAAAQP
ncbi:MAG TPA: hypothetical protein VIC54_04860 [Terriglobales bacterium]|jgi:hypothetical protein